MKNLWPRLRAVLLIVSPVGPGRALPVAGLLLLSLAAAETVQAQTTFHGLVVLIDFPDAVGTIPLARADDIINGVGYTEPTVTASLRDYWFAQSRQTVDLTHDVVGYYRAPQPASWYSGQSFSAFISLAQSALDWVVANNPAYDWNSLSRASGVMNRNGTEEGTFLSIAFMTTAWIPGTGGTHWLPWTAPNGVSTQQIVAGTFVSPWDSDVNLFWLTHEQGHAIWGWPDTYDTTGQSHGTGQYSLMSGNQGTGDIEPVGAPFLVAEGWVQVVDVGVFGRIDLVADGNTVARFRNPLEAREYFLVEARKDSTIGNAAFPVGTGLLIWHVDERVTTSNTLPQRTPAQHYRISVEQADGLFDLEQHVNTGDAGDVFVPGTAFTATTTPDSDWWDGAVSELSIDSIQLLPNDTISFRAATASPANMIQNGTFGAQLAGWVAYGSPTPGVIQHNSAANGVFEFYRQPPAAGTSNQATIFQQTGMATGSGMPLLAQFDLGNSSSVRKRISVLVLAHDFSDLSVCTFWLAANAPMRTYSMRTHTTQAWSNAALYFYAASAGEDGGRYLLDNVVLQYSPNQSSQRTDCIDPTAPSSLGVDGINLLVNGDFGAAGLAPWTTFGTIVSQVAGGVFEFIRPSATPPAGVLLQATGQPMTANQLLTAGFELGNSSAVRKRVTVLVHDQDFSDLAACTFWLAPGQPLTAYSLRTFTTEAWTNATVSVYPATVGAHQWIRLDNVSFRRTPSASITGTHCLEPAIVPDSRPSSRPQGTSTARAASGGLGVQPPGGAGARTDDGAGSTELEEWLSDGFERSDDTAPGTADFTWMARADTAGTRSLTSGRSIVLAGPAGARLTFQSWLTSLASSAVVQVSLNGGAWETLHAVAPSDAWTRLEIRLDGRPGDALWVRFVLDGNRSPDANTADVWKLGDVRVEIEHP